MTPAAKETLSMRTLVCAALVALCLSTPGYAADAPAPASEYGIEASTEGAILPSSASGTLVNTCATCRVPASFQLTADTAYFIGPQAVTFAQFAAYAKSGTHGLMIFVQTNGTAITNVVTRLVVQR
jgi:hypothetical protein